MTNGLQLKNIMPFLAQKPEKNSNTSFMTMQQGGYYEKFWFSIYLFLFCVIVVCYVKNKQIIIFL